MGHAQTKIAEAEAGEVVALGRLDEVRAGRALTSNGAIDGLLPWPAPIAQVYAMAVSSEKRADEVKLSTGMARQIDEDPSLSCEHAKDTHQLPLLGQGEAIVRTS